MTCDNMWEGLISIHQYDERNIKYQIFQLVGVKKKEKEREKHCIHIMGCFL